MPDNEDDFEFEFDSTLRDPSILERSVKSRLDALGAKAIENSAWMKDDQHFPDFMKQLQQEVIRAFWQGFRAGEADAEARYEPYEDDDDT